MNDFSRSKSVSLFLLLCIPSRILIALLPLYIKESWMPILGFLLVVVGIAFVTLFLTNSRLDAVEGGGMTWWKNVRPVHGMLYLLAGALLLNGHRDLASLLLFLDVVVGIAVFANHRLVYETKS